MTSDAANKALLLLLLLLLVMVVVAVMDTGVWGGSGWWLEMSLVSTPSWFVPRLAGWWLDG